MDRTALAAGVAAVKDRENILTEPVVKLLRQENGQKRTEKLGFSFEDSMANFIFAAHESCPAEELFQALRNHHIYVRYFPGKEQAIICVLQ